MRRAENRRSRFHAELSASELPVAREEERRNLRLGCVPETAEEQLAALLRVLRPAPAAWIAAACEIPRVRRELEHPHEGLAPRLPGPGEEVTAPEGPVNTREIRGSSDG